MKKTSMYYNKDSEAAVSPIVATLVLIVVAVVGAVAVGTIMGTFSTDVSKKTNAGDASGASSNEILVAGSTTVQPASEEIAKVYMTAHPGMKITVQGGGSGAGVSSVLAGISDIGASSDLTKITDAQAANPSADLQYYKIGGSAVLFITNVKTGFGPFNVTKQDLVDVYQNGNGTITAEEVYQRADSSGTEETVAKYLFSASSLDTYTAGGLSKSATGNSGVYAAVKDSSKKAIGFADMGFVMDSAGNLKDPAKINIVNLNTYPAVTRANLQAATKAKVASATATSTAYETAMTRGLYYMTKGTPNSVVKNFITFAQSPGSDDAMHAAGVFSNSDLS